MNLLYIHYYELVFLIHFDQVDMVIIEDLVEGVEVLHFVDRQQSQFFVMHDSNLFYRCDWLVDCEDQILLYKHNHYINFA